jgi:hypothetical protein
MRSQTTFVGLFLPVSVLPLPVPLPASFPFPSFKLFVFPAGGFSSLLSFGFQRSFLLRGFGVVTLGFESLGVVTSRFLAFFCAISRLHFIVGGVQLDLER